MITNAKDAVAAADEMLAGHYRYRLPVSAKHRGGHWRVVFDVGAIRYCKLDLTVDADSGVVSGFYPPADPASEASAKVRRHVIHSRRYFDKALTALENRDPWESGKLFWRSVEQAFLGAAVSRHHIVKDRRDLNAFVRQVCDGPDGERLNSDYRAASLGQGFQAIEPDVRDIEERLLQARRALGCAFDLLPTEIADEVEAPGWIGVPLGIEADNESQEAETS